MTERKDRILPVHRDGKKIYDIRMTGSFDGLSEALKEAGIYGSKICIVADSNTSALYASQVKMACESAAVEVFVYTFPAGEEHKNLDTVRSLYTFLIQNHFDRNDVLAALGGGVTGDLTGFAAATYLRGIRFVQIPTSLLSQVDSSIGGKTGVDFDQYKNMVGAFHMPQLVYMNLGTLKTLSDQQFCSGMGEIIKHGFIRDAAYLNDILEHREELMNRDYDTLVRIVGRSCEIKRDVVEQDPYEKGERALLNFGHTLGHAIEKLKNFTMLHGECVAAGCVAAAYLSMKRGNIDQASYEKVRSAVKAFHLPLTFEGISCEDILEATKSDKKMENGHIKFILLHQIGDAYIDRTLTDHELTEALKEIEG